MRNVPGKHHDFKKPARGEPWFTAPLARFIEMIDPFVDGIRTLPDDMLETEHERLVALCGQPDHHLAHRLLHRIFEAERFRRSDPGQQFDIELDQILTRIEQQTNRTDRELVTDIGRSIYRAGGKPALDSAFRRMANLARASKRDLRERTLAKRWAGIGSRQ